MPSKLLLVVGWIISFVAAESELTSRVVLSIFFTPSVPDQYISDLEDELRVRISTALNLNAEDVDLGKLVALPTEFCIPFKIRNPILSVSDSHTTPDSYTLISGRWKAALSADATLVAPITLGDVTVRIITDKYETATLDAKKAFFVKSRNDLLVSLAGRKVVLQLRLKEAKLDAFKTDLQAYARLINGMRSLAAVVLAVPENDVQLYKIKPGSVVAQFTVHPASASMLEDYESKWTTAVKSGHVKLAETFPDFDHAFPPTVLTDLGETYFRELSQQAASSGASAKVIAGAVLGSLAGAAFIGGVTAAVVKRSRRKNKSEGASSGKVTPYDDLTPGVKGLSPTRLSKIDVHGDITPNVHNHR